MGKNQEQDRQEPTDWLYRCMSVARQHQDQFEADCRATYAAYPQLVDAEVEKLLRRLPEFLGTALRDGQIRAIVNFSSIGRTFDGLPDGDGWKMPDCLAWRFQIRLAGQGVEALIGRSCRDPGDLSWQSPDRIVSVPVAQFLPNGRLGT